MKRGGPMTRSRMKRTRRDTGPSPKVRALVLARDEDCCVRCGKWIVSAVYSLQHRKARGAGGTTDPRVNEPANLLTLCGSATTGCHGIVENEERAEAEAEGFWLRDVSKADTTPVLTWRGWLIYGTDGTTSPANEGERA